jgi:hypothetical protein
MGTEKTQPFQVPVAHTYNPRYSGGRNQEDPGGSKPARANRSQNPILKKPNTKKCWWSGSRCRLCKKRERERERERERKRERHNPKIRAAKIMMGRRGKE